jgi:hypothetical protein
LREKEKEQEKENDNEKRLEKNTSYNNNNTNNNFIDSNNQNQNQNKNQINKILCNFDFYINHNKNIFNLLEKIFKKTKDLQIFEIYTNIFELIPYLSQIKIIDLFLIFLNISDLIEKIILKIRIENNIDLLIISELNNINNDIFDIFKYFLFDDFRIINKEKKENLNSNLFNNNNNIISLSEGFIDLILNENFEIFNKFINSFKQKFDVVLKGNLLFINLISPKNNSIFKHKIRNEILPFFLEIKLRISKIEYTENTFIELLNNLEIIFTDMNTEGDYKYKSIPLSFSNTKIRKNEFDK